MQSKSVLFCGAAASALVALSLGGVAQAKTVKKHHPAVAAVASAAEVADLKAKLDFLTQRLDEQAAISRDALAQLKAAQAQSAEAAATAQTAVATAQADQAQIETIPTQVKTAVVASAPKTDKLYYKGISITMGGFAAAESVYRSHDETADISSSFVKMPFPNDPAGRTGETHLTARQSRYSLLAQGDVSPAIHAAFYGEFDFQGAAQTANSNQSDSYNPRIRNLYGAVDWDTYGLHMLAGQNWSLVTLNSRGITPRNEVTPPSIDAQYVPGFDWARQPQIRITKDFNKEIWAAISFENPQTTYGNIKVASGVTVTDAQTPTNGYFAGLTSTSASATAFGTQTNTLSTNDIPDIVGKLAYDKKFGDHTVHLELVGIARNFYDHVLVAPTSGTQAAALALSGGSTNNSNWGGGIGAGALFDLVPRYLDVQGSFLTGNGIGRYGSAGLPDATAGANGKLYGIPETMFLVGATFHPTPLWDVYVFGGQEAEQAKTFNYAQLSASANVFGYGTLPGSNNSGCVIEGSTTCTNLNKSVSQITAGFWDRFYQGPFGSVRVGVQYSYTERQIFADAAGIAPKTNENMIFTSFRYYPF